MQRVIIAGLMIAFLMMGQSSSFARKISMNEGEFTLYVLSALQKSFPHMSFKTAAPLSINGKGKEGGSSMISLGNSYPLYVSNVSSAQKIVEGHISAVKFQSQARSKSVVTRDKILPVLKPKDYFDNIVKQFAAQKKPVPELPLVYRKINSDLYLLYVFDTPKSMRFVMKEDLTTLKLNAKTVEETARKNLVTYFKKHRAHFRKLSQDDEKGIIYYFSAKETYEASALLLLDKPLWNGQIFKVKGQPVIFAPARNVLLITGRKDAKGLTQAAEMARNFYKNYGYGISPFGMVHDGKTWQRFKP